MRMVVMVLCALGPVTAFAWKDSCEFQATRASDADAAGVEKIVIRAGDGNLQVKGRPGGMRVEARGIACARRQGLLAAASLAVHREGPVVYVETRLPNDSMDPSQNPGDMAYIELEVSVPAGIAVEASHGGASVTFEDLQSLTLEDGPGKVVLRRISGVADVTDGKGDLVIEHAGSVHVHDSSGDVEIRDVGGSVTIEKSNAGKVHVTGVDGDLTALGAGAGGLTFESIRGKVSLPERSGG